MYICLSVCLFICLSASCSVIIAYWFFVCWFGHQLDERWLFWWPIAVLRCHHYIVFTVSVAQLANKLIDWLIVYWLVWCCHHHAVIAMVSLVHLMNVVQHQMSFAFNSDTICEQSWQFAVVDTGHRLCGWCFDYFLLCLQCCQCTAGCATLSCKCWVVKCPCNRCDDVT